MPITDWQRRCRGIPLSLLGGKRGGAAPPRVGAGRRPRGTPRRTGRERSPRSPARGERPPEPCETQPAVFRGYLILEVSVMTAGEAN